MNTSLLYHVFGLRDQMVIKIHYDAYFPGIFNKTDNRTF
jgi:hypothetical protein